MPEDNPVEFEQNGDVAIIRLNAPATLNALTFEMVEGFRRISTRRRYRRGRWS